MQEYAASSPPKVLLVCSAGGHLLQLYSLFGPVFSHYQRQWVSLKKPDAQDLLKHEQVTWAYGPTNRNIPNLLRNLALAWRMLGRERPHCIVSTGAGIAVPFMWLGRLFGAHTIYIESFARRHKFSLTGWLVYPFVHEFIVQHPELAAAQPRVAYYGSIY